MKITTLLLIGGCLHISAASLSQTVNLKAKKWTLGEVFDAIRLQTDYQVIYNDELVNPSLEITFAANQMPLEEFLKKVLKPLSLTYQLKESTILVGSMTERLPAQKSAALPEEIITQQHIIVGQVTDDKGSPLAGVNVRIKGMSSGTISNSQGNYSINVTGANAILVFSYVGFGSVERTVGDNNTINVTLSTQDDKLDEVVVVGYGTQKRVNVIGSVSTIENKSLENRPTTNLSSTLSGLAAGVYVNQTSARPGSDGASILVRGTGTLNNTGPLVVIDGIVGSIDAVNLQDVESVSVLKDAATAAIYGSLASNGVILVTTKKGSKEKTVVSYSGLMSSTGPMHLIHAVTDYVRTMQLVNEGFKNIGQAVPYTDATIKLWQDADANPNGLNDIGVPNYVAYPNTDWSKVLFSEKTPLQSHNINLNGGNDKTQFLLSTGYLNNPGTMPNTSADKYQMRINLQSKVANFLTVGTQTFGSQENYGTADLGTVYDRLKNTVPGVYPYYNGQYGFPSAPEESATANNPLWDLHITDGNNRISRLNTTIFANLNIIRGLDLEVKAHYDTYQLESNSHTVSPEKWDFATNTVKVSSQSANQLQTQYSFSKNYSIIFDDVLRYNTTIQQKHDIAAMVGYNQQYYNSYNFNTSKLGLLDPTLTTLNSGTSVIGSSGDESDYAMRSFFGRLNYAYKQRYLLEAVFRYDGSSRFGVAKRWGFFPAFSAGWRISEEPFMKNVQAVLENLKLRASWGRTGNNAAGNYDAQSVYNTTTYSFAGAQSNGLVQTKFPNPNLAWETTEMTNLGLDGTIMHGALDFTIEAYHGKTFGILFTPTIPLTVGNASAPTENIAQVSKDGLELTINYHGKVGDFKYNFSANMAYNKNRVDIYKGQLIEGFINDANGNKVYTSNIGNISSGDYRRILEGHTINEYYLYNIYKGNESYKNADGSVNKNGGPRDGMIRTPDDMAWLQNMMDAGYIFQPANGISKTKIWYGDLIYADANGDGIYGNTYDQQFTGKRSTPSYNYGFGFDLTYKAFDMYMQLAGVAGMSYYWQDLYLTQSIVGLGKSISQLVANDHYFYNDADLSDPNNNTSAHYPRLKNTDAQNSLPSTYYMYDASYLKLKNLQLGYTVPVNISRKAKISNARIYIGGENLLLFTKYPGLDPEIGAGINYPTMRQFTLGLNITF